MCMCIVRVAVHIAQGLLVVRGQLVGIFLSIHHVGSTSGPQAWQQMTFNPLTISLALITLLKATFIFWWPLISEITFIKNGEINSQIIRGSYYL